MCCPRGGPQGTNAEYKAFDGTANPYIGLAALVAAGILGGCMRWGGCVRGRQTPAETAAEAGLSPVAGDAAGGFC